MDFHWGNFKPSWQTNPQLSMNKWYDWPSSTPGNHGSNFWCPTASSEGQLRGSLSQRVDLCTEAFCHLLGTFGLGNACQEHRKINEGPIQQDCGQKVMWHNEVMLAFCRAIFLGRVMDKHRLVAQSNLLWVIPILGPGWVAANVWPIFGELKPIALQLNMHATAPQFLVYHIQVNVKDLPFYLSKYQMHHFTMFTHDNPYLMYLSFGCVWKCGLPKKKVMFIIFHTKNVDKWQCLNFKQVGFKVSQHYLEVM